MKAFLQKQGHNILEKQNYALFLVVIFSWLPLCNWLALTILALITLRMGTYPGIKCLLLGFIASLLSAAMEPSLPYSSYSDSVTFWLVYLGALILRFTASYELLALFFFSLSFVAIAIFQWFFPDYVMQQFKVLVALLKEFGQSDLLDSFLSKPQLIQSPVLANYLLGVKMLLLVLSSLFALLLARYLQSLLFYPEGFRAEMQTFKARIAGIVLFFVMLLAAFQGHYFAVACLPLLSFYLVAAGLSFFLYLALRQKQAARLLWLLLFLLVLPYLLILLCLLIGTFDGLFDFRARLQAKEGRD